MTSFRNSSLERDLGFRRGRGVEGGGGERGGGGLGGEEGGEGGGGGERK